MKDLGLLDFIVTKRTDERLISRMAIHYSQPKGFVGRNICYAIMFDSIYYGHIVAGSATRFLPNRNDYFGITISKLNNIVNNIFFNISYSNGSKYPIRNFTSVVVEKWISIVQNDWRDKYGDTVIGFETLVEKPRIGELYIKAGWECIGETKGFTCKRISGVSSDNWSGKRVWNTDKGNLRPKWVLCYKCTR